MNLKSSGNSEDGARLNYLQ